MNDTRTETAPAMTASIDINDDFLRALEIIEETRKHVFITGHAGTGKSTFLQYLREQTRKKHVVLAPTGVAAVHIKGQTIHSFFHFRPDITVDTVPLVRIDPRKRSLYKKLDMLIIDEISMVRADLLDCVDAFLRLYGPHEKKPFGGIQLVVIGDLYQLSPVVTPHERHIFETHYASPYFFDARVIAEIQWTILEFERNYRQDDEHFRKILNAVRTNTLAQDDIDAFNERCLPDWDYSDEDFSVYLTTTNKLANEINYLRVHELKEDLYTSEGRMKGEFDQKSLPTAENLDLKIGAQVMLLNNDPQGRWVNGTIGKIVDIFDAGNSGKGVQVELADDRRVEVEPFTWELYRFFYDEDTDTIESDIVGSFRQFPLKLAWAITIHKSQGQTFDKVVIDIGRGTFCHGQLYVALSRCRTLGGIVLKRPIARQHVQMDAKVTAFMTASLRHQAARTIPSEDKQRIIAAAIDRDEELEILYLRDNHEKHRRRIIPRQLRTIVHNGTPQDGVEAFCVDRQAHWIFRLDNILEIKTVNE